MVKKAIVVVVSVTPHPDQAAAVKEALMAVLPPTKSEAGCIRYDLYADLGVAGGFVLIGEFTDEAALDRHDASSYLKNAVAILRNLAHIKVTRLGPVDE